MIDDSTRDARAAMVLDMLDFVLNACKNDRTTIQVGVRCGPKITLQARELKALLDTHPLLPRTE